MSEPSDTATTTEEAPKKKGLGSTALRFASALPLIPVALWLMFAAPEWAFDAFAFLWMAIVANELFRMVMPNHLIQRVAGFLNTLVFAGALVYSWNFPGKEAAIFASAMGIIAALSLFASLAKPEPMETSAARLGWLFGGPIYVGGTLSALIGLQHQENGGAWVLLALFCAFMSDTGAYFAGRAFGKNKLYPLLSPKKTKEGSVGGLLAAALGGVALQQTLLSDSLPLSHAIGISIIAAALGQAGDLLESMIKRATGVKDSGNIMPGHGGLLDRSDALMFTGLVVWIYRAWMTAG